MAQPPQMPKCGQIGAIRCGLSVSTRMTSRPCGCPGALSPPTASRGSAAAIKIGPSSRSATPSPRWPMRSMTRCSITFGLDKEFSIAIAAEDRRRNDTADAPAERSDDGADVLANHLVNGLVAHDALLAVAAVG